MNESLWIKNVRLVVPGICIAPGSIMIERGKIAALMAPPDIPKGRPIPIDGGGRLLTPGLIDVHTHGMHRFMYEKGAEDLLAIARLLPACGTTCVFPTLVPVAGPKLLRMLDELAAAISQVRDVAMPGLHLEGPFVTLTGAACAPLAGDVGYLKELLAAAHHRVAIMSISPDAPSILPVIAHLRSEGVAVFMTHTRATVEQTQAAIAAGARHATHFYDVFPVPPECEPGVRPAGAVEAILADPRVSVDFICDGCHVSPVAIRVALAAKGPEGVAAITDSNIGAGLPPGIYDTPWGYPVRVKPGEGARIADANHRYNGCLAGSALTMNEGIRNLLKWLELPAEQVWAMGTCTPARILNLPGKGVLAVGADADLVLWNDGLMPERTWFAGQTVYQSGGDAA